MTKFFYLNLVFFIELVNGVSITNRTIQKNIFNQTRRILNGQEARETRPYMVYLRPAPDGHPSTATWLCGGVILDERYVLTSAACIEDTKHFYVVSGTHRWVHPDEKDDECVKLGAMKAVSKCVPKEYTYDGDHFDNIHWMDRDIAVVKVEEDFNFEKRVRGCEFIPKPIAYNNISEDLEKPGTMGSVAGWGSTNEFSALRSKINLNSPVLLETDVMIISKKNCKKRWADRYHKIIDDNMVCAKDSEITTCRETDLDCKDLGGNTYVDYEDDARLRRLMDADEPAVNTYDARRAGKTVIKTGGFCENDHGGPLVVGHGKGALVTGIVSACLTKGRGNHCYGPYLYTSVWKYRYVIECALGKNLGMRRFHKQTCRELLRTIKSRLKHTVFNWTKHPDGPSRPEASGSPYVFRADKDEDYIEVEYVM